MEKLSNSDQHNPIEGDLWSRYPKPWDDVVKRSSDIDLREHLSPEDIDKLSRETGELGITDAEQFLRAQVVRLSDIQEVDAGTQQVQPSDFIAQVLSVTRDGSYA